MGLKFRTIGIERLRVINDGAGITTLVAGHGCPLRCKYCLNPQYFEQPGPVAEYTVEELIREVAIDDLYFQATGGGVVFGGGEPLLQADFIHAFRQQCPKEWKISLESSLAVPGTELEKVIDDIDFFLIDIKDMNGEIYQNYTGRSNENVIQNLKRLVEANKVTQTTIRIPLIPGFNTETDRQESIKYLQEMGFLFFDPFRYEVELALGKRKAVKNHK
ncbi:MAG: radical SAM protein [Lachnospiraceae bacterium]|nr:radical SAM protein [Lachnospiraceae bacterium]